MVRAIVFDVDGVLIRPWGFADLLRERHGISRATTEEFFRGPFVTCLVGRANLEDTLPPYLARWGWPGSTHEFIRLWLESDDTPSADALAAVARFRRPGDIVCVASNQERLRARCIESDMGFAARFDKLFFSCDLGVMKPDEAFYAAVQSELHLAPQQIHFWDDSPRHMQAARDAGWNARVYQRPQDIA
jgi:putative hydrolase of the HAD superfamily